MDHDHPFIGILAAALIASLITNRRGVGRIFEATGGVASLLGPALYGPPHPGPWHRGIDWPALLGGEPVTMYGDEW